MLKKLRGSKLFLAGAALLVVGSAPLLLYLLYEFVTGRTGGNPIGLGLLLFVSFWPAVILMGIGAFSALLRRNGGGNP
ncbi:MAG: hypothetical protein A2X31_06765 [Elusimicrobia bacterium GWB2_63_22]|nr:MAG: hypothetical protein A2X31_06765 [Elusimicrobia bacterium GWB2_63_22]